MKCVMEVFSAPHDPYYCFLQQVSQPQILGPPSPILIRQPAIKHLRLTAADGVRLDLYYARQYLGTSLMRRVEL
jgi:hypothetical protein